MSLLGARSELILSGRFPDLSTSRHCRTFEHVAITTQLIETARVDAQKYSNTEFSDSDRKDEQARIGALFQKLDSLIALHQRERAGV